MRDHDSVLIASHLAYKGDTTQDFNDPATVAARLTDHNANWLSGETVTFTLNGVETCSATTGSPVTTVTKSGAMINGDDVHIVIVRTDPGYGPQPSSTGTGTIVAVLT